MEALFEFERAVLFFFNHKLSPGADAWMIFLSSETIWVLGGVLYLAIAYAKRSLEMLKAFVLVGLVIGLSDMFAAYVLKPEIGRIRPCKAFSIIRVVSGCAGSYSMPSNHALNAMVLAGYALGARQLRVFLWLFVIALAVGLSRVYSGVHFPFDILLGWILGGSFGFFGGRLAELLPKLSPLKVSRDVKKNRWLGGSFSSHFAMKNHKQG